MSGSSQQPADAFTKLWTDMMSRMTSAAASAMPGMGASAVPPPAPSDEFLKQMRQSFFDAWARSCDEFMRSDQFLDMMKRSMDSALAFRKQMNEFLTRALSDGQMPSRQDTDALMDVLRSFQERVLDQLQSLSQRVEALERRAGEPPAAATTRSGGARRAGK